jgi:O-antigen/teichoic acid export membrane protein
VVNAGPVTVQLFATPAERARAGAFLAALVVVRIAVFLFTAVQPSFLPAMAAHAAADRKREFVRLLSRVLSACLALTVASTVAAVAVGPDTIRILFGFQQGLSSLTFLAMGLSVGLYLTAMILAQALLARGRHKWTTVGWLLALAGTVAGTCVPLTAVDRATAGFLSGAFAAAGAFAVLLVAVMHRWRPAADAAAPAEREPLIAGAGRAVAEASGAAP